MYMSNVSKNVHQTLMNTSCFVKSYFFDWGESKVYAGKNKKIIFPIYAVFAIWVN